MFRRYEVSKSVVHEQMRDLRGPSRTTCFQHVPCSRKCVGAAARTPFTINVDKDNQRNDA